MPVERGDLLLVRYLVRRLCVLGASLPSGFVQLLDMLSRARTVTQIERVNFLLILCFVLRQRPLRAPPPSEPIRLLDTPLRELTAT